VRWYRALMNSLARRTSKSILKSDAEKREAGAKRRAGRKKGHLLLVPAHNRCVRFWNSPRIGASCCLNGGTGGRSCYRAASNDYVTRGHARCCQANDSATNAFRLFVASLITAAQFGSDTPCLNRYPTGRSMEKTAKTHLRFGRSRWEV
jgi:hypothetical protein